MTKGKEMHFRIAMAAIGVGVVGICTAAAFGVEAVLGPEIETTQGTVAHAGPIGMKGSTNFTLAGSDWGYNCYTSEAQECSMIKEGNRVSISYYVYLSGARSVESLKFLDDETTPTP